MRAGRGWGTVVQGPVGQGEELGFDPKGEGALRGCGQRGRGGCSQAPSRGFYEDDRLNVLQGRGPGDQGGGMHRSTWETMGLDQVEAEEWGEMGRFRIEF